MPHSTTKLLFTSALALAVSAAVATAATASPTGPSGQTSGPSAGAITANDIALLDAAPVVPAQEAVGTNNGRVHVALKATYANDYWFRYHDIGPNRFNFMVNGKLDVNLGTAGDVYLKSFADFSSNIKKPYINGLAQGTTGIGTAHDNSGYMPSSDFTQLNIALGYHYDVMGLLGFDTGYADYITPVDAFPPAEPGPGARVPSAQTAMQEWFFKFTLNDQRFLGDFALHPYVYIGLDFDGSYYTAGAGQYWELGINPCYTVPNTGGLKIHPYWNISFISNEAYLDRSSATTGVANSRDGYLGTTVGVGVSYPINSVLNIPAGYGTYSVGGFVEGVFAGNRYEQPTGSRGQAAVAGMDIAMTY